MVPDTYRVGSTSGVATSTKRTTRSALIRPGRHRARPDRITRWSWSGQGPAMALRGRRAKAQQRAAAGGRRPHRRPAAAAYLSWKFALSELPSAVTIETRQHVLT